MYEFLGECQSGTACFTQNHKFAGASPTDALDWVYGPNFATRLPVTLESN